MYPNGLSTIRKHIFRNFIPFMLLLIITASASIYHDREYGVYGAIGLVSITALFFIMSFMENTTTIEQFKDTQDESNIQLLKALKELHSCVESSENANTSLPNKLQRKDISKKLEQMKRDIVSIMDSVSKQEHFKEKGGSISCDTPINSVISKKLDDVVKQIVELNDDVDNEEEYCDCALIRAFIKYMLVDKPSYFFDPPISSSTSVETYKQRAMALFKILKKRREYDCKKMTLILKCLDNFEGILPLTGVEDDKRDFTFTPLEVQNMIHNPAKMLLYIDANMNSPETSGMSGKQLQKMKNATIVRIIQLMSYLKDSKQSKDSKNTDIYVLV